MGGTSVRNQSLVRTHDGVSESRQSLELVITVEISSSHWYCPLCGYKELSGTSTTLSVAVQSQLDPFVFVGHSKYVKVCFFVDTGDSCSLVSKNAGVRSGKSFRSADGIQHLNTSNGKSLAISGLVDAIISFGRMRMKHILGV